MAKKVVKDSKTYWIDVDGDSVKLCNISKEQKEDDKLVEGVFGLVNKYQEYAEKTKGKILEKIGKTDRKTFYNFDKSKKLEIQNKKRIEFNDKLEQAHEKIREYVEKKGASEEVLLIVSKAFKRTRKGDADPSQIFKLKELSFNDSLWIEAMTLIDESQTYIPVKTYFQFSHRDETGAWIKDKLNFSAI
jgi:Protein of unknown function (DUF3164)